MAEDKIYTLEELQKKLTEKERVICHEYIIDWNGTRAAIAAGYSEISARQLAHDTLTKHYIKQYINFIKDDIEKECNISKIKQVKALQTIIDDSLTTNKDKMTAIAELNKMIGYNAPEKHENKLDISVSEQKEAARKFIENAEKF